MRPLAVSGAATCPVSGRLWNDLPPGLQSPGTPGTALPSTPSDQLWNLIHLATQALGDSVESTGAIQINLSIYLSIYLTVCVESSV